MNKAIRITAADGGWNLVVVTGITGARFSAKLDPGSMPDNLRPPMRDGKYMPYPTEKGAEIAARGIMDLWNTEFTSNED